MTEPLLHVSGLTVAYGAVTAVHDLSLSVNTGEVVALLGANGAGKSSTLRAIGGLLRPVRGTVELNGASILKRQPEDLLARGLASVPDTRDLFPRFSVAENLRMGAYHLSASEALARRTRVLTLFPALERLLPRPAWTLSGGEQQMLALARALITQPRILLLDEPSLGLAPLAVRAIFAVLAEVRATGTALLLAEQTTAAALSIADQALVLRNGRVALSGAASELRHDHRVLDLYLGSDGSSTPR